MSGLAGPFPAAVLAHLGEGKADRNTGELARVLDMLAKIPILEGVLIKSVTVPGISTATVSHKLGRKPRGWIALRPRNAIACVYETQSDARSLVLANAITAAVTLDLWVY